MRLLGPLTLCLGVAGGDLHQGRRAHPQPALTYELAEPLSLPPGARIDCVAHFDNSPSNKYNPNPSVEVKWGGQTWEEMMIGWFTYPIPAGRSLVLPARSGD